MQSLAALAHFDFNAAGAYGYEQALLVMRRLGLPTPMLEEQFRRMAFNIVARNQDDHVKNIAFLMDQEGSWSLAPAFDMTYSYNPSGPWTAQHQMTLNDKRDGFTLPPDIEGFRTRRINFTFRYVPTEHVITFGKLGAEAREDVRGYVEQLQQPDVRV